MRVRAAVKKQDRILDVSHKIGEGSDPGVKRAAHLENGSQGSKTALAAPKAYLTVGYSLHLLHHKGYQKILDPVN
jgi:hypothetical protein